jgi:BirA family transcriptional regulator, biotin operon repressor / biotin---[acetyl-CoA-carboxylase] ligase
MNDFTPVIIRLDEVDSTNRYGQDNFAELTDGTLITADCQTSGRGRRGRVWISPPGQNIYASFVVKRPIEPIWNAARILSLATLNVFDLFVPDLECAIKWPNDIYCNGKKIAGILCEAHTTANNRPDGAVLGIGININMLQETLDKIDHPATSLLAECGHEFVIEKFINALAISLKQCYINYFQSADGLFTLWKERNFLLGKSVDVTDEKDVIRTGNVLDLAPDGALIVDFGNGPELLHCGDVSVRKKLDL